MTDGAIRFVGENKHLLDDSFTPLQGAYTPLFAAADPIVWRERSKYGGAYLVPYGAIAEPNENGKNAELAKELWETSEREVGRVLAG